MDLIDLFWEVLKPAWDAQYQTLGLLIIAAVLIGYILLILRNLLWKDRIKQWNEIKDFDKLFLSFLVGLLPLLASSFILLIALVISSVFPFIKGPAQENPYEFILFFSLFTGVLAFRQIDEDTTRNNNILKELIEYLFESMIFAVFSFFEVVVVFIGYELKNLLPNNLGFLIVSIPLTLLLLLAISKMHSMLK